MTGLVLAVEPASAPVTQWPLRIALVLVVVGVIALVLLGMRRGWLRRARAQESIAAPPLPTGDPDVGVNGVYVGTTSHGDWLDRIVVHDLGVRSRMRAQVGPEGVSLWREGARDVLIPTASLRGATLARGIAGKAYERDGVLVITWELDGRLMDTGLRADTAEDQRTLLEDVLAATGHGAGEVKR